ncbi:golgin IMH1-like [Pimephales promelas]|uniref:golgin IMH1-like n=1 Tax=Pimephales promelas TaxID=90988 RepID=UPI0019556281|nr:golgin IMH1-like [Pimephales promelas]
MEERGHRRTWLQCQRKINRVTGDKPRCQPLELLDGYELESPRSSADSLDIDGETVSCKIKFPMTTFLPGLTVQQPPQTTFYNFTQPPAKQHGYCPDLQPGVTLKVQLSSPSAWPQDIHHSTDLQMTRNSKSHQHILKRFQDSGRLHQWTLCKNMMTDGKYSVDIDSESEFMQELLPSAERTALLYHMSYLCVGKDPELERLLRKQAVETQLLFGSSEALLMKCVRTSESFVTSLLPNLKLAAEKNKPQLAFKFLEKAKDRIGDIIIDVKDFVKRYNEHNSDVASSTSDINTVKEEMKTMQQQQSSEMEELQKMIDVLEANLLNISKDIEDYEKKKNEEINEFFIRTTGTKEENDLQNKMTSTSDKDQIMALYADLQKRLKEREWDIQNQLMDNQQKMAKLKTGNGQMPIITHLDEVQKYLSRIQKILVQLQKFWEKVGSLLDMLKERTFAGDVWIEDLTDMKEEFLESIDAAQEEWIKFGINSKKAYDIFSVQAIEAYRFLEISPSSLSEEEWQNEYESVKDKLEKITP